LISTIIYGSTFIPNKAQSMLSTSANSTAHGISALLALRISVVITLYFWSHYEII